ncbi:MAG: aminotransferase class V-fold PLP-dependent enzyme [Gemmataceae bacterium]|nr:aminotransferase class V-fold PLP-dependent enzyme [Gemmataceae bacterium]
MLHETSREKYFPSLKNQVYLNTAAEGIPPPTVEKALQQYFHHKSLGMDGRDFHFKELDALKTTVSKMLGFSPEEIAVCSCSSEAFNLAALALNLQEGDEVVINDLDFPAGATPWLQPHFRGKTRIWKARDWALHTEDLLPLLGEKTQLVTLSLVSFFNGFKINLQETVAAIRQRSDALIAVDVTQALGRISFNLADIDLVVSSTHKWILGPHGGGLVAVPEKKAARWVVPAGGWFHLKDAFGPERFQRAESKPGAAGFSVGMPNFPAIYATRAAVDFISEVGVANIEKAANPLVEMAYQGVQKFGVEMLLPPGENRRAGIFAFRHPNADRIHASLKAQNIHLMHQAGRLRVAIHGYNTVKDVESFLAALAKEVR